MASAEGSGSAKTATEASHLPIPDLLSGNSAVPPVRSSSTRDVVDVATVSNNSNTTGISSLIAAARLAPQAITGSGLNKKVSYRQLTVDLRENALTSEVRKSQKKMISFIFPKLAVYSTVDPSLASSLLILLQNCQNPAVLRYAYYYTSRILSESGDPMNMPGGSVPTPAVVTLSVDVIASGGPPLAREEACKQILKRVIMEAATTEPGVHQRRIAALKALVCVPFEMEEEFTALVKIIFMILDAVMDGQKKRRRRSSLFRGLLQDKDGQIKASLHKAALSALRRLPLDPENAALIEKIVFGIGCADPLGSRHALAMAVELAKENPVGVASTLARLGGGSLAETLKSTDVFARTYLARLCGILLHSPQLYERSDWRGLFSAVLYQLIYDESDKVFLEAAMAISGSIDGEASGDQRAYGWQILTTSFTDGKPAPAGKEDAKTEEPKPELVLQAIVNRLDAVLLSSSRPTLHFGLRVVSEIGKARAAAYALGYENEEQIEIFDSLDDDEEDFDRVMHRAPAKKPEEESSAPAPITVASLLSLLMEAVRVASVCDCLFVRAQALKAIIWMQAQGESTVESMSTIKGELQDPAWTTPMLNDLFHTLHLRFKVSPGMAVQILDMANLFVAHVPGKVDIASIQALWKICLVGCGPEGKHLALEAVTEVLDRPPPPPPSSTSSLTPSPASAVALQRLLQCAIYFLGENANYGSAEYAWEGSLPPSSLMLMLDNDRRVAAGGSRNATMGSAISRLMRCVAASSWEERVIASHALITIALRSGEPFRLQIYEFFHSLIYGGGGINDGLSSVSSLAFKIGEDGGATGTGLRSIISPMLRVLDEMYQSQEIMMRDIQHHDIHREPWSDEELKKIYEMHERLMDLTLLFCFVPRAQYLPLGPVSAPLIDAYRSDHGIDAKTSPTDAAVKESLIKLLNLTEGARVTPEFPPVTLLEPISDKELAYNPNEEEFSEAPTEPAYASAVNFDAIWASSLVEDDSASDYKEEDYDEDELSDDSASNNDGSNLKNWDEQSFSGSKSQKNSNEKFSGANFDEAYEAELRQNFGGKAGSKTAKAVYEFYAQDDDELSLRLGEEVQVEYEVDGWYYVTKNQPNADGKTSGLVPALYVK